MLLSSTPSTPSTSSSSSPVHHASLVDPLTHSPVLLQLIDIKLSRPVIEYVVDCVSDTVDYAMGRPPSSSRGRSAAQQIKLASFTTFVTNVISRAEISTPVVLASLVYIDRAKPHLHIALEEWALERVFLGALMAASKYLNDSTLKNVHWALCTGVFGKRDVGRIEREFLDVLDFELRIAEGDILSHHAGLLAVAAPAHARLSSTSPPRHRHHHRHRHVAQPVSSLQAQNTHRRSSAHHDRVPALSPSSPQSSSSESSPSTPGPSPISKEPSPKSQKPLHVSTMELLRAFPIPHPMPLVNGGHQHHPLHFAHEI